MKKRKIICKNCGKIFEAETPRAAYCSAECKVEGAKKLRKDWEQKNPTYNADYFKNKGGKTGLKRRSGNRTYVTRGF